MLLAEPPNTDYDLRFTVLGFPVRIAVTFWLGAVVFGYELARFASEVIFRGEIGVAPLLIGWAGCLLLSILIHELGHALAFRYYGIESSIVLYHFGGLAIPSGASFSSYAAPRMDEKRDLIIASAGPALQLLSAFVVILLVKLAGYQVFAFHLMPSFLAGLPWVTEGDMLDNRGLLSLITFYILPSVLWALLNLVPVYPLDGGRIARSLIVLNGGTVLQSLWVSVIASAGLAIYALQNGQTMMAIFFGMFAFSNYQMMTPMNNGWR
ncbi:site-2 protease family protein [Roseiconus lacunae]|uniref:Site-2 protease family protein n=1 Tax=Roseiconus lacunae TaxID=2605694 RepID=A0ABT7PLV0_9BACT|nr:site-2 protease family protein [Roseiconus lacunae]MDM4017489.1 site-2 protease family protein [Roseiconus lacunae]WRQ53738.1 site-2 protease family protein [Stieleria sp. HD01]